MSLSAAERGQLLKGKALLEADQINKGMDVILGVFTDHPFDKDCLTMAGYGYQKARDFPVAYHLFRTATERYPDDADPWLNLGLACADMWLVEEAEKHYHRAIRLGARSNTLRLALSNMAALYVDTGRHVDAEKWALQCLEHFPDFKGARSNLGHAQLGQGKFSEGWKNYRLCLGEKERTKIQYGDEPEWQGEPGQRLVVYGEQGIGDEICFASMLPDAIRDSSKVIVDCDVRLAKLFSRSFPRATVYGTRQFKAHDKSLWRESDRDIDASIPSAQLGEYYRNSREEFPRTPYLVPDPERVLMWKALFATRSKPVIGIAWSGGTQGNGKKWRTCDLKDWAPLFKAVDAHYVSLQYQPAQVEIDAFKSQGVDLVEYPWATITRDYDDTAGLVAALDCVVGVPTSVIHLAGALGVPTFAMAARMRCWKYAQGNLFHPCTNVEWAGNWTDTIAAAVPQIEELCSESSSVTTRASRSPTTSSSSQLRDAVRNQLQSRPLSSISFPSNGAG